MNNAARAMRLTGPSEQPLLDELDLLVELLDFEGARVLDLGCGAAEKTRLLVERTPVNAVVAAEVDAIQHQENLRSAHSAKIDFQSFGAEQIAADSSSFDAVLMFKSLHHVPTIHLDKALQEIHRVLRPGGLAYISEPVFAGAFNEVLRLFHDESAVRQAAFQALQRAVEQGLLTLVSERFFRNRLVFPSFETFDQRLMQATHTDHQIDQTLREQIRDRFEAHRSPEGYCFEVPNRIDVLQKAA